MKAFVRKLPTFPFRRVGKKNRKYGEIYLQKYMNGFPYMVSIRYILPNLAHTWVSKASSHCWKCWRYFVKLPSSSISSCMRISNEKWRLSPRLISMYSLYTKECPCPVSRAFAAFFREILTFLNGWRVRYFRARFPNVNFSRKRTCAHAFRLLLCSSKQERGHRMHFFDFSKHCRKGDRNNL